MSSDESVIDETDKQALFVSVLKKHAILLNKSQLPNVKIKKAAASDAFIREYNKQTGILYTNSQLLKKINNMKTEVKKKSDVKRTGNKAIHLKEWEKAMLNLIEADVNPSISSVKGIFLQID